MRGIELTEAVAARPGKAVRDLRERAVERGEHRLRVVPVGRVGRRVDVGRDRDRVTESGPPLPEPPPPLPFTVGSKRTYTWYVPGCCGTICMLMSNVLRLGSVK